MSEPVAAPNPVCYRVRHKIVGAHSVREPGAAPDPFAHGLGSYSHPHVGIHAREGSANQPSPSVGRQVQTYVLFPS